MAETTKSRWFHLTPGRCIGLLLIVECFLWFSERFHWFPFNAHKGWTVLMAMATVAVFLLLMLLWLAVALMFRLRFQFSIRTLLVLTVAVASPCSWFAFEVKKAKEQKEALTAIVAGGGVCAYDWERDENGYPIRARLPQPPGPEWLRRQLGIDFLAEVVCVDFTTTLARKVSQPSFFAVERIKNFMSLALDPTHVMDAELEHLRGLSQLKVLVLAGSRVTDKGLKLLTEMTSLQTLNLGYSDVTDVGMEYISNLPTLRELSLGYTRITDVGLQKLAKLARLQKLNLSHTDVTDVGLHSLSGLAELVNLYVSYPKVTSQGVNELQQALPNCRIAVLR